MALEKPETSVADLALPIRQGSRPRTTPTNPHSQRDQMPTPLLSQELAKRIAQLPGIRLGLSGRAPPRHDRLLPEGAGRPRSGRGLPAGPRVRPPPSESGRQPPPAPAGTAAEQGDRERLGGEASPRRPAHRFPRHRHGVRAPESGRNRSGPHARDRLLALRARPLSHPLRPGLQAIVPGGFRRISPSCLARAPRPRDSSPRRSRAARTAARSPESPFRLR